MTFSLLSMLLRLFFLFLAFVSPIGMTFADNVTNDINVRDTSIGNAGIQNSYLEGFIGPIHEFFFRPEVTGGQ